MLHLRGNTKKRFTVVFCGLITIAITSFAAQTTNNPIPANVFGANKAATPPPTVIPPPPNVDAASYVLMDATTGQIIVAKNMDAHRAPASLTKMMSLYLFSEALASGKIKSEELVPISSQAWKTGGSRMFVKAGDRVPVSDLLQGIIVDSGNDATVALAEFVAGSVDTFVPMMNQQTARLGMTESNFTDPTGLPAPNHYSSAHDMAVLARHLISDFPQFYHWYGQKTFTYANIQQQNRNKLLWSDSSVDGMKTGFTNQAGYCLVASAKRDGMRLISVIMGAPSPAARVKDNQALLNYGFRFFKTYEIYKANTPITQVRAWFGDDKNAQLGLKHSLVLTLPIGQYQYLKAKVEPVAKIDAPVLKGHQYGSVTLLLNDKPLLSEPLIALQDNPRGNMFKRLSDYIGLAIEHMFNKHSSEQAGNGK